MTEIAEYQTETVTASTTLPATQSQPMIVQTGGAAQTAQVIQASINLGVQLNW